MSIHSGHPAQTVWFNTATSSVTTAWATLSSLTASVSVVELYNSTTVAFTLGVAATSATTPLSIIPMTFFPSGGNGRIHLLLESNMKLFVRAAEAATASSGVIGLNLFR